jgi:C-terminal processing protease CtpA/Prc
MKKRTLAFAITFLLIIFLLPLVKAQNKFDLNKKIPLEELQSDFIFLRKALEEAHPTLYWYTSKEEMDQAFEITYSKINKDMTERDFYKVLTPLIEYIKCSHTNLSISEKYKNYLKKEARYFPLAVWIDENDHNVLIRNNNTADTTIKAGFQILTINKIPVNDIARKFVEFTPTDGYNQTGKFRYTERKFSSYIHYFIGEPDTFSIQLINFNKDTLSYNLLSMKRKELLEIAKQKGKEKEKKSTEEKKEQKEPVKKHKIVQLRNNDFRIIENDSLKVGYLRLRDFDTPWMGRLYRPAFRQLKKNKVEQLVIDVRENPGGYSSNAVKLMRFLSDDSFNYYKNVTMKDNNISFKRQLDDRFVLFLYTTFLVKQQNEKGTHNIRFVIGQNGNREKKRINFTKDTYILTTGLTSSAASLFAANMQYQKKAVVIGEETGGGFYGCAGGLIPFLTLPNSRVKLRFPLMQFENAVSNHPKGRGTLPDHEVKIDFLEFSKGKDNQLKYTLKTISDKNKK